MRNRSHIVIVGGGFSGVSLAVQLLRRADSGLKITLIEAGDRLGRGVAFKTNEAAHVLNTRAGHMSLIQDEPQHFVHWNERSGTPVGSADFVSRTTFGHYVEDTFIETIGLAGSRRTEVVTHLQTQVVDIACLLDRFVIALDDGQTVDCDKVVMATGLPLPSDPLKDWLAPDTARYLRDPWQNDSFNGISPDDRVLLLGSGLTMVDSVLTLESRCHRAPIHAFSRRGLLPRAHRDPVQTLPVDLEARLHAAMAAGDLRLVLRSVRNTIREAAERGFSWHAVIDAMRPVTSALWANMSPADRMRFLRWLRPYWDVHRHRLAPGPAATIGAMLADSRLKLSAGRVTHARACGGRIIVEQRLRGRTEVLCGIFDWVINCTGPDYGGNQARTLEQRLIARGLLKPDTLGLGYITGPMGEAWGADGGVPGLYLLGAACRPRSWEHTAVPELRQQVGMLAAALSKRQGKPRHSARATVLPFLRTRRQAAVAGRYSAGRQ